MKKDAKKHISDEAFLKQVKATLDNAAQEIDPATETRLRVMRREAVAQVGERLGKQQSFRTWQWGGAVAATVLVAVLAFNVQNDSGENSVLENLAALEDLHMLSSPDDLELYQDLEFYQELELYSRLDEVQKTG